MPAVCPCQTPRSDWINSWPARLYRFRPPSPWRSDLGHQGQDQRPAPGAPVEKPRQALVDRALPHRPVGVGGDPGQELHGVLARLLEEAARIALDETPGDQV